LPDFSAGKSLARTALSKTPQQNLADVRAEAIEGAANSVDIDLRIYPPVYRALFDYAFNLRVDAEC
jgi:hypothetical protein